MSDQSETGFKYLFYNSAQPWSDSEQTWHGVREDLKSCTFAEEKEELSFLQLKGEAVLAMSLRVKQYPRVPQGFKFQRDALQRHLSRPGTQPEEKAAAAVEAHHVGIWGSEKNHTLNKVHSCLCLSRHSEEDDTLTLTECRSATSLTPTVSLSKHQIKNVSCDASVTGCDESEALLLTLLLKTAQTPNYSKVHFSSTFLFRWNEVKACFYTVSSIWTNRQACYFNI